MSWRPAPSTQAMFLEANHRWPNRNKASDGTIGDAAHSARESDHNPDPRGVVHAGDLTHDPAHGVDCNLLAAAVVVRRDPRLRYLIWAGRIVKGPWSDGVMAGRARPWVWEVYRGTNPHTRHMHISVGYSAAAEQSMASWWGQEEVDVTKDELIDVLRTALSPGFDTVSEWASQLNKVKAVSDQHTAQLRELKAAVDRLAFGENPLEGTVSVVGTLDLKRIEQP